MVLKYSTDHNDVAKLLWAMPLDDQMRIVAMICATTDLLERKPLWYREWIKRQADYAGVLADLVGNYKREYDE